MSVPVSETQTNITDGPTVSGATASQFNPDIISLNASTNFPSGGYVVVWQDASQDAEPDSPGGDQRILARIYNSDGTPRTGEIDVSGIAGPQDDQTLPRVAADQDGGFIVVFQDADSDTDFDIEIVRINENGNGTADVTIGGSSDLSSPDVAVFSDGSYAVVYASDDTTNRDNSDIVVRIFDDTNAVVDTFTVSASATDETNPRIDILTNGNMLITFEDQVGTDNKDPRFVIMQPDGTVVVAAQDLATSTEDQSDPVVASLTGGGFVAVYSDAASTFDFEEGGIFYTVRTATGGTVTNALRGNADTPSRQFDPAVVALANGGFLITYIDEETNNLMVRQFNAFGSAVTDNFALSDLPVSSIAVANGGITLLENGELAYSYTVEDLIGDLDIRSGTFGISDIPLPIEETGDGNDNVINGGEADDILEGEGGNDTLNGFGGDDSLIGGDDNDDLFGGDGDDRLIDDDGDDELFGGDGNDILIAGVGTNTLDGGEGDDTFIVGAGADTIIGGTGLDLLNYFKSTEAITVNLTTNTFTGGGTANDTISGIDGVLGTAFDDHLTGNNENNQLFGAEGEDTLIGVGGRNDLDGGEDNDTLRGGTGVDWMFGGTGDDFLESSLGADFIGSGTRAQLFGNTFSLLDGSAGDIISYANSNAGVQFLTQNRFGDWLGTGGHAEGDTIFGARSNIVGSQFNDVLRNPNFDATDTYLEGLDGDDILRGAYDQRGSDGDDSLYVAGLRNGVSSIVNGGADHDTAYYTGASFFGVSVDLEIQGVAQTVAIGQNDTLISIESVHGSSGSDLLQGDDQNNNLTAGRGFDTLRGRGGDDNLFAGNQFGNPATSDPTSFSVTRENYNGGEGTDTLHYNFTFTNATNRNGVFSEFTFLKASELQFPPNDIAVNSFILETKYTYTLTQSHFYDVSNNFGQLVYGHNEDVITDIEFINFAGELFSFIELSNLDNTETLGSTNAFVIGNDGNDVISSGTGHSVIRGDGGNDTLSSVGGISYLYGGDDDDTIIAGTGLDYIDGGDGIDTVSYENSASGVMVGVELPDDPEFSIGGSAEGDEIFDVENITGSNYDDVLSVIVLRTGFNSVLRGLDGNDILSADRGNDILDGGEGIDTADYTSLTFQNLDLTLGGTFNNTPNFVDTLISIENVWGGGGNDTLTGDHQNNQFKGNSGEDELNGGLGNDELDGGDDNDILNGGGGNDNLIGGLGDDDIDGGSEIDTVDYSAITTSVNVILNGSATGIDIGTDTITNVENILGGSASDTLNGDGLANTISGGDGGDNINGGGSNDFITGGLGADTIDGGDGDFDTVNYGQSASGITISLTGGGGSGGEAQGDTVTNVEQVIGSLFGDTIIGNDANNVFFAFDGDDQLFGGEGSDFLLGGAGADHLDGGNGILDTADYRSSQAGVTVDLLAGTGLGGDAEGDTLVDIDQTLGSAFGDNLTGNDVDNILFGFSGDDMLSTGIGNDFLVSGLGADTLDGGQGSDTANYLSSTDRVTVDLANNVALFGEAEGDTLISIENLIGTNSTDVLFGNAEDNLLFGFGGNDVFNFTAGIDTINGGANQDRVDFDGNIADYGFVDRSDIAAGVVFVADGTGVNVTALFDIEQVQFNDTGILDLQTLV